MYVGLHPMIIFIMNESADYFLKYFYCFASKVQKNANYNYPEPKVIQFQWDVSCTYGTYHAHVYILGLYWNIFA